jgi:nitrite reductase (NADH) small subunit
MPSGQRRRYVVGTLDDFPVGHHHVVRVGRREIGVFNVQGRLYGLPNLCPHQTGPLCEAPATTGTLIARADKEWRLAWCYDGEVVACPWHGLEFHIPTGQCLAMKEIRLRQYSVLVDGEDVVVEI